MKGGIGGGGLGEDCKVEEEGDGEKGGGLGPHGKTWAGAAVECTLDGGGFRRRDNRGYEVATSRKSLHHKSQQAFRLSGHSH